MTTLMKRAENLEATLLTRGQKKAGVVLQGRLVEVQSRAESASVQLKSLASFREEFGLNGIQVPEISKPIAAAIKKAQTSLRRIATELKKEDSSEQDLIQVMARQAFNETIQAIPRIQSDIKKVLEKTITEHRSGILPASISEQVPDAPGKAAVVGRLRRCRDRLNANVVVNVDRNGPGFQDLESILEEIQRDIDTWVQDLPVVLEAFAQQSPELQTFIAAVGAPDGAPLEMITPALLETLRDNQTISQYRVRSL